MNPTDRRTFLQSLAAGASGVAATPIFGQSPSKPEYTGPNVIIVRFGGGARRQETILDPRNTWTPYLCRELTRRGVLFQNMLIDHFARPDKSQRQVDTSHGQGTIYILTGNYAKLDTAGGGGFDERFVPSVPTVFEYFRNAYQIPEHQTLIINSEDRKQEEFLTYSNHVKFGFENRCQILSLYRYKRYLLPLQLRDNQAEAQPLNDQTRQKKQQELDQLLAIDQRQKVQENARLAQFWELWRDHYGESGFRNPRGDRLLTELALWAMGAAQPFQGQPAAAPLEPKLLMINYTDSDYIHWGIKSHYYNALGIMDQGLRQIVQAADSLPAYRENTLFVIVPDCGRDNNPLADVPFQHHFNTKSAHQIFCLLFDNRVRPNGATGTSPPLIKPAKKPVTDTVDQVQIAGTIARLMDFKAAQAATPLEIA